MAYTTAEGREELLEVLVEAANDLALASACLGEAYEQLDEQSGDRLEEACFKPVQTALGRAKRTHTEFAGRHGLEPSEFSTASPGLPSQRPADFIEHAIEMVGSADGLLSGLQDSMLPIEAGDEQLRAGIVSVREPLDDFSGRARQFLSGLGR